MLYNPHVHRRHSIRLPSFDYRQFGAYFVTICSYRKEPLFGEIVDTTIRLSEAGYIVNEEWLRTDACHSNVKTDEFVVMPNHVHGIIWLRRDVGAQRAAPLHPDDAPLSSVLPNSLGAVIRGFKSASTKRINELRGAPTSPVWQRNYYEHVIRNDRELDRAREYIANNPLKWSGDRNNPQFVRQTI